MSFNSLKREAIMQIKKSSTLTQLNSILCALLLRTSTLASKHPTSKKYQGLNDLSVMSYMNSRLLRAPITSRSTRHIRSNSTHPDSQTIKQIIIVHRHGARIPSRALANDISWPTSDIFWRKFATSLTPVGSKQMHEIGQDLRDYYINHTSLFKGIPVSEISNHVFVQSSNKHRDIFSAWSLLRGMFPQTPSNFTYHEDRVELNMKEIRRKIHSEGNSLGIPIVIEHSDRNVLFNQYKMDKTYKKWRLTNLRNVPLLKELCKEPKYIALANKLHKMTGLEKLNAAKYSTLQRILSFKLIHTHLVISKAHNLPAIPNISGLRLTHDEQEMIKTVANITWAKSFRSAISNNVQDGKGPISAGFLAHEIQRHMYERIPHENKGNRMVQYSCCDITLSALAARLGVDVPAPSFGAYFLFELHNPKNFNKSMDIEPFVKVFYNPNPETMARNYLLPIKLSLDGKNRDVNNLPIGSCSLEDFTRFCEMDGLKITMGAFRKCASMTAVDRLVSNNFTDHKMSTKNYEMVFKMFTKRDRDSLTKEELFAALRTLDISMNPSHFEKLFSTIDKDSSGKICIDEFTTMVDILSPRPKSKPLQIGTEAIGRGSGGSPTHRRSPRLRGSSKPLLLPRRRGSPKHGESLSSRKIKELSTPKITISPSPPGSPRQLASRVTALSSPLQKNFLTPTNNINMCSDFSLGSDGSMGSSGPDTSTVSDSDEDYDDGTHEGANNDENVNDKD